MLTLLIFLSSYYSDCYPFPGGQANPRHLCVHWGFAGHEVDAGGSDQGGSEATIGRRNPERTRPASHRSSSQCSHLQSESKGNWNFQIGVYFQIKINPNKVKTKNTAPIFPYPGAITEQTPNITAFSLRLKKWPKLTVMSKYLSSSFY